MAIFRSACSSPVGRIKLRKTASILTADLDAAAAAGVRALPVDTLTEGAPQDDLLQGVLDIADEIAAAQDCPLLTPSATDRPG